MSAMPHWQLHSRLCFAHFTSSVSAARRSRIAISDSRRFPAGTTCEIGRAAAVDPFEATA